MAALYITTMKDANS